MAPSLQYGVSNGTFTHDEELPRLNTARLRAALIDLCFTHSGGELEDRTPHLFRGPHLANGLDHRDPCSPIIDDTCSYQNELTYPATWGRAMGLHYMYQNGRRGWARTSVFLLYKNNAVTRLATRR